MYVCMYIFVLNLCIFTNNYIINCSIENKFIIMFTLTIINKLYLYSLHKIVCICPHHRIVHVYEVNAILCFCEVLSDNSILYRHSFYVYFHRPLFLVPFVVHPKQRTYSIYNVVLLVIPLVYLLPSYTK